MFLSNILILYIKVFMLILVKCEDFCDKRHEKHLIDGLFNINNTLYAYRKPYVWIIDNLKWKTSVTPILFNQLFTGITLDSMQSGFTITGFSQPKRPLSSFDLNGITFIFDGNRYHVCKYHSNTWFDTIHSDDRNNIPWNSSSFGSLKDGLKLNGNINGVVYNTFTKMVYFVNDSYVNVYPLKNSIVDPVNVNPLPVKFFRGNGGIFDEENKILFFADNHVWTYSQTQGLISMNQDYWQYFQCEQFVAEQENSAITIEQQFDLFLKRVIIMMFVFFLFVAIIVVLITLVIYIALQKIDRNKIEEKETIDLDTEPIESDANLNNTSSN